MSKKDSALAKKFAARGSHGQSMVEFALVVSALLLIVIGIMEFGRALYIYNAITNSAREAVHYGIIAPADTTGIQNAAINTAVAVGLTTSNITITCSPCSSGN